VRTKRELAGLPSFVHFAPIESDLVAKIGIRVPISGALVRFCRFSGDGTQTVSRIPIARSGIRTQVQSLIVPLHYHDNSSKRRRQNGNRLAGPVFSTRACYYSPPPLRPSPYGTAYASGPGPRPSGPGLTCPPPPLGPLDRARGSPSSCSWKRSLPAWPAPAKRPPPRAPISPG
jgi:hypothetical protein